MKLYLFGTGYHFNRLLPYLSGHEILGALDNDPQKQGRIVNGVLVMSPYEVDYSVCDMVIIAVQLYKKIEEQLRSIGVSDEKIIYYPHIEEYLDIPMFLRRGHECIEYAMGNDYDVLILSHDLSRTGVPVVAMNTAILMMKLGIHVILASLYDGNLEEEIINNEIPYIKDLELYTYEHWRRFAHDFKLCIMGTICVSPFGNAIVGSGISMIWWLHESIRSEYEGRFLPTNSSNVKFYGVGRRTIDMFKKFYPETSIERLPYYLPAVDSCRKQSKSGKITFCIVGSFIHRKAQDVFLEAIKLVNRDRGGRAEYFFIGSLKNQQFKIDWEYEEKNTSGIHVLGELSQSEMRELYEQMDILVCPSRDDPLPIVVTEAMQIGIVCIVSKDVGQSEYIENGKNGFVVETGDAIGLADAMIYCIDHGIEIKEIGERSKTIYEAFFSEESMKHKIENIVFRYL